MRSALIAALVSAVVASGSAVAATKLIDGHSIRDHTIPAGKLTRAAIASLRGVPTTFTLARGPNVSVLPGSQGTSLALCPDGSSPVGGGFIVNSATGPPDVYASTIDTVNGTTTDGWDATLGDPNSGTLTFHSWGICANQTIRIPG